ncbi:MAG: 4-hydroxy-tetrahydrodipicolinate synthase [Bacteroidales bacterium]|nr:4-hydroxy-tetrahydrodipicolinate synthase [Bacteroidales bacterium]
MKHTFQGTGVALVTPFKNDFSVDVEALQKITEHTIAGGVEYLVALGTTSEAPVLSKEEKKLVVKTIIEATGNRVPIVLGVGGNNTAEIIHQLQNETFEGISAILSVVPYYNKPTQNGIFAHFDAIAHASPLPIILYNVPGRTSANMNAETTISLAEKHSNIIGVKEASGDFAQIMEIIRLKPVHFAVISGDDALTMPMIALGGSGVISVAANALSRQFSEMVRLQLENKTLEARKLHYSMLPMIGLLFSEGNPAGIKSLLNAMDLCEEFVRLPLVSVSKKTKDLIKTEWTKISNI